MLNFYGDSISLQNTSGGEFSQKHLVTDPSLLFQKHITNESRCAAGTLLGAEGRRRSAPDTRTIAHGTSGHKHWIRKVILPSQSSKKDSIFKPNRIFYSSMYDSPIFKTEDLKILQKRDVNIPRNARVTNHQTRSPRATSAWP